MACTPDESGTVCGPQYDIRKWTGLNGDRTDAVNYYMKKVNKGELIDAASYDALNALIFQESERRRNSTVIYVDPEPNQIIMAQWYNELAVNLTSRLSTQAASGTDEAVGVTGYYGNGSNNAPFVQQNPPPCPTNPVNNVPGNSNMVIGANKNLGGDLEDGFNELVDSLIFAGQQCYCNCNFCSCNCNFCTCNCNFGCTCNCNY